MQQPDNRWEEQAAQTVVDSGTGRRIYNGLTNTKSGVQTKWPISLLPGDSLCYT
jgi:hypothetical protein